jgi:hypothetical protein
MENISTITFEYYEIWHMPGGNITMPPNTYNVELSSKLVVKAVPSSDFNDTSN